MANTNGIVEKRWRRCEYKKNTHTLSLFSVQNGIGNVLMSTLLQSILDSTGELDHCLRLLLNCVGLWFNHIPFVRVSFASVITAFVFVSPIHILNLTNLTGSEVNFVYNFRPASVQQSDNTISLSKFKIFVRNASQHIPSY